MTGPREPKIRPVDPDTCRPDIAEMLRAGGVTTGGADNVSATLANNPGSSGGSCPSPGSCSAPGSCPRATVSWRSCVPRGSADRTKSGATHVRIAREEGLTADLIEAVKKGPGADGWADHDAAVLTAA